jgi:hypothetical protein
MRQPCGGTARESISLAARPRGVITVRVPTLSKNQLVLVAGLVWCAAGTMVCMVGLPLQLTLAQQHMILVPLAASVFLVFHRFVFSRLVGKHTSRIRARTEERLPCWQFFNGPSWVVMAVMMGGGLVLRHSQLTPDWMIAFFYTGLGLALFVSGVRFLGVFARRDVLARAPEGVRSDG